MVAAPDGSVYFGGNFSGFLDLGVGTLFGGALGAAYVAKLDPSGRAIWSRDFGDTTSSLLTGLAVTPSGELVCVGSFQGTIDLGGTRVAANGSGGFLVVLDACGRVRTSKMFVGTQSVVLSSVAVDEEGSSVVTGSFQGTLDFGSGPMIADPSASFIAKYSASGELLWGQRTGTNARGLVVATDRTGSTFVAGQLTGPTDVGPTHLEPISPPRPSAFLMKFERSGTALWSLFERGGSLEPGAQSAVRSLFVDAQGGVVLANTYANQSVDWGNGAATAWTCCGDNASVTRVDAAGRPLWTRWLDSNASAQISADGDGIVATAPRDVAGFRVTRLDSSGTPLGSTRYGIGGNVNHVYGVTVDAWHSIVVAGSFHGSLDLGQGALVASGSGATTDGFVAKLKME